MSFPSSATGEPTTAVSSVLPASSSPIAPPPPALARAKPARVMVVDDAATVRMYCRHILEADGCVVDEAVNGLEAIEKALGAPCDVFLVDINMMGMDGYSMLRLIRRDPVLCAVPAIMISSEAKEADQMKAFEAGANLYLIKPVPPERLRAAVALMTGRTPQ